MSLTVAQRDELLVRARRAGARAVGIAAQAEALPEPAGALAAPGASFVTWRRDGRLRGCIGSLEPHRPLAADVESNSASALVQDPRFAPSTSRDFPTLDVEISVLGKRKRISGIEEIEIGRDGLYVEKGKRRALLLPQVAPEWKWSVEEFFEQLCLKAGLPGQAFRDPSTSLFRFEAEVFGERG